MSEQDAPHIIDADQRLSRSLLWDIQRRYFRRRGAAAWQADEVPHYISSNPFMARAYSRVAFAYLQDCLAAAQTSDFSLNAAQPIYIIELGAGSGRLAHHFLHQFRRRLAGSALADFPITYVMTDFVPETVAFWAEHGRFRPWVEAGWLDFALFDAAAKRPLTLHAGGQTLTPERMENPVILIANYFFDSVPQDSFAIVDGQLCENLLTVSSARPEPDLADPAIWERLQLTYEAIPLAGDYYQEAVYNRILAAYEAYLPDTVFSFPNVGLDCIRFWRQFGNGRLLALTADRGYTLAESLVGGSDPRPNLHGSFSLMVNYHAIGQYVELAGGLSLHPAHYQDNLQVAAYLLGRRPRQGRETRRAFADAVVEGGPDDFFALKEALTPHLAALTLPQLLSYLRWSAWDATVFQDCFPTLLKRVQAAEPVWHGDVAAALRRIWRQYLPLQGADPVADAVARLLREMGYGWDVIAAADSEDRYAAQTDATD